MTPLEKFAVVLAALVVVCGVVGFLFYWFVGSRRDPSWELAEWQRDPEDLPGGEVPAPTAGEYQEDYQWADQLHAINAELSDEPAPLHLEPWNERAWWDDPDLVVWDAKRQADRCWEILHVEFPRLRAELCAA